MVLLVPGSLVVPCVAALAAMARLTRVLSGVYEVAAGEANGDGGEDWRSLPLVRATIGWASSFRATHRSPIRSGHLRQCGLRLGKFGSLDCGARAPSLLRGSRIWLW